MAIVVYDGMKIASADSKPGMVPKLLVLKVALEVEDIVVITAEEVAWLEADAVG